MIETPAQVPFLSVGQVPSGDPMLNDIRFRCTVMPFVAVIGGVLIGYLLAKPTMDNVNQTIAFVKRYANLVGIQF